MQPPVPDLPRAERAQPAHDRFCVSDGPGPRDRLGDKGCRAPVAVSLFGENDRDAASCSSDPFPYPGLLLIVIPGPSVGFTVSRGVALGRRAALATVLGGAVKLREVLAEGAFHSPSTASETTGSYRP
jgi:hypothetical protein